MTEYNATLSEKNADLNKALSVIFFENNNDIFKVC